MKRRHIAPRKLLVASVGVATLNYLGVAPTACGGEAIEHDKNTTDGSVATGGKTGSGGAVGSGGKPPPSPTVANLMAPPGPTMTPPPFPTVANLMAPPPPTIVDASIDAPPVKRTDAGMTDGSSPKEASSD
jgi:hypothetical protein